MASEPDLYELLGVSRDADAAAIKAAYRKMAMQYHPDRNPGDAEAEARFKAIGAAYEVLKAPQKRAAYDQYGHAAFQQGGGGGRGGHQADVGDIGDIFETIFGSAFGVMRQGARRGADRVPRLQGKLVHDLRGPGEGADKAAGREPGLRG